MSLVCVPSNGHCTLHILERRYVTISVLIWVITVTLAILAPELELSKWVYTFALTLTHKQRDQPIITTGSTNAVTKQPSSTLLPAHNKS